MLRTHIEYLINDVGRVVTMALVPAGAGLQATLHGPDFIEPRLLENCAAWAGSGFAMIAKGLEKYKVELNQEVGAITSLKMTISSADVSASADVGYSIMTFERRHAIHKFVTTGPVLHMSVPIKEGAVPATLGDLLQLLLAICDPGISQNAPVCSPRIYEGEGVEPFIFVEELPVMVQRWFVAHVKHSNPTALYREERVATARAYQNFCGAN